MRGRGVRRLRRAARRRALAHADGASITTIEGVATGETLHTIQESFLECGGAQCGICTPGMVLAAFELLSRNPEPSENDIRAALGGNLCRCTGYMRIFASVLDACRKLPVGPRP
jgi:carbon-monoxide dehydrogenase small subunit